MNICYRDMVCYYCFFLEAMGYRKVRVPDLHHTILSIYTDQHSYCYCVSDIMRVRCATEVAVS